MTNPPSGKKEFIRQVFSDISPRYDRLNRIMSLTLDQRWRKRAVQDLVRDKLIVDLCAGTGDMALALLQNPQFRSDVVLVDFNSDMLSLAERKLKTAGFRSRFSIVVADVENLPFENNKFDGAIQGFALRNLENLEKFFAETLRVLKPGKSVRFLEIAHPENRVFQKLFYFYFYNLLPRFTTFVTGNGRAYNWLPQSLQQFPQQKEAAELMRKSGFKDAGYKNLAGGMVACYFGTK
jgi:demethylmenaquinone methyltransferase/2-methoxy-6-polyprenyl-1,4-benzoquinol methylase